MHVCDHLTDLNFIVAGAWNSVNPNMDDVRICFLSLWALDLMKKHLCISWSWCVLPICNLFPFDHSCQTCTNLDFFSVGSILYVARTGGYWVPKVFCSSFRSFLLNSYAHLLESICIQFLNHIGAGTLFSLQGRVTVEMGLMLLHISWNLRTSFFSFSLMTSLPRKRIK
jgi:hypothetical protein